MTELLVVILVLIVLARVTGEVMQRLGQLAILGELLIGIALWAIIAYGPFTQPVPVPLIVSAVFSSIVIMAIVTTVIVPLTMKPLLKV